MIRHFSSITKALLAPAVIIAMALQSCGTSASENNNEGNKESKKNSEEYWIESGYEFPTRYFDSVYIARTVALSDKDYPENPNIGRRSKHHGKVSHSLIRFLHQNQSNFNIQILPDNKNSDTIQLDGIDLSVYIMGLPEHIKENPYLTYIGIINQEWNRQQIHYQDKYFTVTGNDLESDIISRVDIARNCLNAGLWEVILYTKEDGEERVYYHGWFDFPRALYESLFENKLEMAYEEYKKPLEKWVEPENNKIDLSDIREVKSSKEASFTSHNDELYPLTGSRAKKHQNIVYPKEPEEIEDFLTDSARFSTFAQPGKYTTKTPRKTKLGRLANLKKVEVRETDNPARPNETMMEFDLHFKDNKGKRDTRLVVGGINMEDIPQFSFKEHHKGFQMPMGIANHSFYEPYDVAINNRVEHNPYFGMLLNGENEWLDSHNIGIDGPLMHKDAEDPNKLHFYILSFERHALVGHYVIDLNKVLS